MPTDPYTAGGDVAGGSTAGGPPPAGGTPTPIVGGNDPWTAGGDVAGGSTAGGPAPAPDIVGEQGGPPGAARLTRRRLLLLSRPRRTAPIVLPADLIAAFIARFNTATTLPALIAGGIATLRGTDPGRLPRAVIESDDSTLELATSTSTAHATRLKVRVYSADLDEAGRLAAALAGQMGGAALFWDQGRSSIPIVRDKGDRHEPARYVDGVEVYSQERCFHYREIRSR